MSRIAAMREEMGGAHPLAAKKVKDHLEPYLAAFIENASFAVMASADADGNCDASPKGGHPGFVRVVDERTLFIPDVGGNRLFQSFENFESNAKAGFVFMIPGMEVTARVNGRVNIIEATDVAARGIDVEVHHPDDNAIMVQGIELSIDEAYFHCPRSMQFADLWNTEVIDTNKARSLKSLKEG
ncbi:MAG: pyridoxamine 5'-phosphate oxidase family protein [Pseudomonadota bacterium]